MLTGDGQLKEGSNWEAFMAAAHHGLENVVVIVDRKRLQQGARTEDTNGIAPLDRLRGVRVGGARGRRHAIEELLGAFDAVPFQAGKPGCIIARTVKGGGVSFMEDPRRVHHKVPSREHVDQALAELRA